MSRAAPGRPKQAAVPSGDRPRYAADEGQTDHRLREPLATHFDRVGPAWRSVTDAFRAGESGRRLLAFVDGRVGAGAEVYPHEPLRALALTPLPHVKAVILGQDPYHGPGQAEGLAFSVPRGVAPPPSLRNIHRELADDLGDLPPAHGSLVRWAQQGVLLLNTSLTVERKKPASHAKQGWEVLTDMLIDVVAADTAPKAFLLWGAHAQAKAARIEAVALGHLVLTANHPSPLSARRAPVPFLGSRPFSRAATFLAGHGRALDWRLAE
jgi:uracil-DNA glycosylase